MKLNQKQNHLLYISNRIQWFFTCQACRNEKNSGEAVTSSKNVGQPVKLIKKIVRTFNWSCLMLIWVGLLRVCFAVKGKEGGGGLKLPYLKLVRIMLES